jgi:hypothetical protein
MVLVLDASGSMNEPDGHGWTKIAAARSAVTARRAGRVGEPPGAARRGREDRGQGRDPDRAVAAAAAAAIPPGVAGSVVLVSDGKDPCALKVDASARSQLTCSSQATGGT